MRDGQVTGDQAHHLAGAIARRIDDDLTVDDVFIAIRGARGDGPRVVRVLHEADHSLESAHARAESAGGACHCVRDLRRIDVTVERIPQRAH